MFAILVMTVLIAVPCAVSKSVHSKNESYFRVTFIKEVDGIMTHEYVFEIQNLDSKSRKFYLGGLFQQTDFPLSEIHNVKIYEYEPIKKTYPVYRQENVTVKYTVNQTNQKIPNNCWWIIKNKTYACNITRTVSDGTKVKSVLSWVELNITRENKFLNKISSRHGTVRKGKQKTMIFKHAVVVLPPYGSKCKYDDLGNPYDCNGTKIFKVVFTTPIEKNGKGWGSSGLFAVYDYNTNEYFHPWWNSTWQYRRQINITGSYTDLYNYQVAINLTYDSNMNPDFSDIRFTWLNQTSNTEVEIPYWIESKVNSSWSYVWVKVPYIPANSTAILYVYYGNPNASDIGDPNKVFIDYDNYDDGIISPNWWVTNYEGERCGVFSSTGDLNAFEQYGWAWINGTGTIDTIQTDCLGLLAGWFGKSWTINMTNIPPLVMEGDINIKYHYVSGTTANYGTMFGFLIQNNSVGYHLTCDWKDIGGTTYDGFACGKLVNDVAYQSVNNNGEVWVDNETYHLKFIYSPNILSLYVNGTQEVNFTNVTVLTGLNHIGFFGIVRNIGDVLEFRIDNFKIRKYANPEPTYTIGPEQAPPKFYSVTYLAPSNYSAYQKTTVTVNWTTSPGYTVNNAYLEINATGTYKNYTMSAGTGGIFTWSNVLPAGYFCFRSYGNSTGVWNRTSQYCLKIKKATPQTEIDMINDSVVYGSSYWNNAWVYPDFVVDNKLPILVYRNGKLIENDSGLVARWSFDEGNRTFVKDTVGTNDGHFYGEVFNDGTLENMYALKFDGVDDYVEVPNSASLNITGNITVCAWVKTTITGTRQAIVSKGDYVGWRLFVDEYGYIDFGVTNATGYYFQYGTFATGYKIPENKWVFVCGQYNGSFLKIYADGEVVRNEYIGSFQLNSNIYPTYVGTTQTGSSSILRWYFNGTIDEVRIYNRSLNSTEIQELYSGGPGANIVTDGLVLWQDYQKKTTLDYSGNGNNGIIHGNPQWVVDEPRHGWVSGKFGKALSFDGVDDYVNISNSIDVIPKVGDYNRTITLWVKIPEQPAGTYAYHNDIIRAGSWGISTTSGFNTNGGLLDIFAYPYDNGSVWQIYSKTGILNKLAFVAVTWSFDPTTNTSVVKIYINGTLDVVVNKTGTAFNWVGATDLRIGTGAGGPIKADLIDEVRIYNRTLSANEIKEIYENNTFIRNGLIAYWRFDEGKGNIAYDTHNIVKTDNAGGSKFGKALSFDGVDDYVEVPNISNYMTGDFSWCLWAETKSLKNQQIFVPPYVVRLNVEGNTGKWFVWYEWYNSTGTLFTSYYKTAYSLSDGKFHFVCAVMDNTTIRIYFDGNLVQERNIGYHVRSTGYTYGLLGTDYAHINYFNGTIDEVRIYNRALSDEEIKELYLYGSSKFAAGTYNYNITITGNQNYTSSSISRTFTILKATPKFNFFVNGTELKQGETMTFRYPTSLLINVTGCPTFGAGDVYCQLWRNDTGMLVNKTGVGSFSYSFIPHAGVYEFTVNNTEGQNYSVSTLDPTIVVVQSGVNVSLTYHNITYGDAESITCHANNTDTTANLTLWLNNTLLAYNQSSTPTINYYLANYSFPSGIYYLICNISATQNFTAAENKQAFNISKATPLLNEYIPSNRTYNGTASISNFSVSTHNNQVYCSLYMNGSLVGTTNTYITDARASGGIYTYTFSCLETQNYTSAEISGAYEIYKATPTLTEQIPNNKTYDGNISIANFTIQTINNQLYAVLELNNNTIGNTTTTISDSRDSAGIYCYYFYTNGNENYTSNSVQACYEIYKATPILNLYIDGKYENKTITWLNISTITANESNSGDSDVVYCLYRNSTLINCQTGNAKIINATQLQSGTYVFTFNNTAGQNYTASSIKLYLTVKKAWNQTNNIYAGKPYMYDLGVEGIPISIHVNRFQDPNRITESGGYAYNLLNVTIFNNGTYYGVEPTNFTNIHVNVTEIMPDGWSSNIDNYTVSELNSGTSNTTYVPIRKFGVINDSLYSISALNKSVVVGKPLYVNFTFIVNNTDTIPYRNVLVNLSDDGIESAWSSILNASFVDLNANSTKKISSVVNKTTVYEVSYLISRADIDYLRKYTYIATLNVTENTVTKNLSIIYKIPLSRLTEWSYKSSVSVLVDGSNKNVSIVGNAVIIGNEHTNSSLHYGTHTVTLVYYVPITPAGGGGGGVSYIPSTNETVYISNLKPEEKVPVSVVLMGKNINVTIISDNGSVVYNKMLNGVDRIKLIPSNYTIVAERYGIQQRYKVTIKYPTMLEININKPPMVGQIPGVGINKYFFISIIIVISALLIYFKDYVMETVYDVWHSLVRL